MRCLYFGCKIVVMVFVVGFMIVVLLGVSLLVSV